MTEKEFMIFGKVLLALSLLSLILGLAPMLVSAASSIAVLAGIVVIIGGGIGIALCTNTTFNSGFTAIYATLINKKEK